MEAFADKDEGVSNVQRLLLPTGSSLAVEYPGLPP